jgi:DGQHR domain-containing protein
MVKKQEFITVDAVELEQNGQKLYLCGLTAKQLGSLASVNKRDPEKDQGYQRLFSETHVRGIKRFLELGKCIPVSVLATFKGATFSKGQLKLKVGKRNGWIIDGQHRFLAALSLSKEIVLPIVAFINLDMSKQIEHFVTINREAKGVPSSLYLDLLKRLPKEKTPGEHAKERATDIARELSSNEKSPFFGKIVVLTSPKKGEISLTNFARKVSPLLKKGSCLAPFKSKEQIGILSNYFDGITDAFPSEADKSPPVWFQTIGFGAFLDFLPVFFGSVYSGTKSFTRDQVREALAGMKPDFQSWRDGGTGTQAEGVAAQSLEDIFDAGGGDDGDSQIKL